MIIIEWVNFNYSLFLRKERSDLKLVNLKIRDLEYENLKKLAQNKTKQFINEFIFTENQADILEDITENYSNLLNGERLKFERWREF